MRQHLTSRASAAGRCRRRPRSRTESALAWPSAHHWLGNRLETRRVEKPDHAAAWYKEIYRDLPEGITRELETLYQVPDLGAFPTRLEAADRLFRAAIGRVGTSRPGPAGSASGRGA